MRCYTSFHQRNPLNVSLASIKVFKAETCFKSNQSNTSMWCNQKGVFKTQAYYLHWLHIRLFGQRTPLSIWGVLCTLYVCADWMTHGPMTPARSTATGGGLCWLKWLPATFPVSSAIYNHQGALVLRAANVLLVHTSFVLHSPQMWHENWRRKEVCLKCIKEKVSQLKVSAAEELKRQLRGREEWWRACSKDVGILVDQGSECYLPLSKINAYLTQLETALVLTCLHPLKLQQSLITLLGTKQDKQELIQSPPLKMNGRLEAEKENTQNEE